MKKFKKIYVEITSSCNLNCSFCQNNKRKKEEITLENFNHIIKEIKPYTDYIYLHVKGEPLLHSQLIDIIKIANKENIKVNITTNATLLLKQLPDLLKVNVRQYNLSLHSQNNNPKYIEEILYCTDKLSEKSYVSLRLWNMNDNTLNKKSTEIVEKIFLHYNIPIQNISNKPNSIKISKNVYLDKEETFTWPTLDKQNIQSEGFCYGLTTHIGILVDGTVIPCCLDSEGIINLGNIYNESLKSILNSKRAKQIIEKFKQNKCEERLCKNCTYKNKFKKN